MKTALITGAGSGLGQALALEYANQDYIIYLIGRNEEKLNTSKDLIEQSGGQAKVFTCDITDWDAVSNLAKQIDQVDLLINNAGIGYFNTLEDLEKHEIDTMVNVNVNGMIYVTKHFLTNLRSSNGRMLNIISTAGLKGKVQESAYCASKFAQRGFTESLQKELAEENVVVSAVYMGGMNTPFWEGSDFVKDPSFLPSPQDYAKQIVAQDDGRHEIHVK
ncbi:SDR family NAD(P)-dependent oxidoreductase [Alkalibacillus haloalkaliphilus]|uniref:SDR family NAD(P)-dependent oxidoreductase n=1 Tax=Alkalibacillus haloalkaliphilus TaxID=94136 RepID=UPI002935E758|nr:SDR family oxidoreductase [Alkalibacillus haloalkaliphilus]MDV2581870.1 SDR family oxidoreductase [Alkalibacillus haloalkaliphilus]